MDRELAQAFEKRMRLAEDVLANKAKAGLPIYDPAQEAKVILRNSDNISDPVIREYYVRFLQSLMDLSKDYQQRLAGMMKVAYCGAPGAFAHIACRKMFPGAEHIPFPDFESAYKACEDGTVDVAVMPVENSYSGIVGGVLDLSFGGGLFVNMMFELTVTQNLVGLKGTAISDIKKVVSHPQALSQCAAFISEHGIEAVEFGNTALAAKHVAETGDKSIAAIASADTAELYGLEVISPAINASAWNTTRFAVFSRVKNTPADAGGEHFILEFTVKNEAGALAKVLNVIGVHRFNMSNLHSRPTKGSLWKHWFFAELEGDVDSADGQELLRQMSTVCDCLKLVGTYKTLAL